MLSLSTSAHATPPAPPTAMVTDVGGVSEVALAPYVGEAPRSARVALREGIWVVHADVEGRDLPASLPARPGERVHVFDASGATCMATLGRAEVISRRSNEFQDGDDARPAAADDRGLIESVWDAEPGDHRLVAPLQGAGKCKHPVFILAGSEAPGLYVRQVRDPSPALEKRAIQALLALPEAARHQPDYDAFRAQEPGKGPVRWEEQEGAVKTVRVLHGEAGDALIAVSLSAGEGCSGFSASVGALYRVADGKLELVQVLDGLDVGELVGVVRGEGGDRLLFPLMQVTAPAAGERTSEDVGTPYHTCGC